MNLYGLLTAGIFVNREVSHLVAFLASDRAGYINGEEIHIDGGMRLNASTLGSRKELKYKGLG